MSKQGWRAAAAALALVSVMAQASPLATVEAVQPPAWLKRGGIHLALSAGAVVQAGDEFITGSGGRVRIAMSDLSVVKLGENGRLEIPRLESRPLDGDGNGLFSSALKVLKGAFRFTTSELGKLRKREIDVAIGPTITAGIRGTDIWGKSDDEQELLCLIEGKIEIGSPGHDTQVMDQAKTFYVVPHGAEPLPVAPTPAGKLEKWAPQTELRADGAALTAAGGFMVGLESSVDPDAAQQAVKKFSEQGYPAEIVRAQVNGKTWYRVVITGLDSIGEAQRFAEQAKQQLKLKTPWVMAQPNL